MAVTPVTNTLYGLASGLMLSGVGNVGIGFTAGVGIIGDENVAVGDNSGASVVGSSNTGVGTLASDTISGGYNTGTGYASSSNIVGNANAGVGAFASTNVTGSANAGLGFQASVQVTGSANTAAGASSGQQVTGSANSALGVAAGQGVTGNANVAVGQNAGSAGAGNASTTATASANLAADVATQSNKQRVLESVLAEQTTAASPQVNAATAPAPVYGVQGSNNVAIGTNAGLGNGTPFSDTVAIGTSASATQASAVALGANSSATAANAVALGAGSIADQANTVSVGAPGAERRIVNVAPGVAASDAATYGQLSQAIHSTEQQINHVATVANKGVAMSMAQAGAADAAVKPGETAVAVGTGYFEGNTALGVGVTRASSDGERVFRAGSAISPGLSDIGLQASYQVRVNQSKSATEKQVEHQHLSVPFAFWNQHGFTRVVQIVPGRIYTALNTGRMFRLTLGDFVSATGTQWAVQVDEMHTDGEWSHVSAMDQVDSNAKMTIALQQVITALDAYVRGPAPGVH